MSNQGRRGSLSIVLGGIMVVAWIGGCEYGGEPTTGCQTDNDCAEVFASVDQCEKAVCHKLTRVCIKLAREDGWGCDDQDRCTGPDRCESGACVGVLNPLFCECSQDDDCPISANPCDGRYVCRSDDKCGIDPDSIPSCDELEGHTDPCRETRCVPSPEAPEGWACVAVPANEAEACDDSDACTQVSSCQDGECVGEDPVDCDDDNACTLDFCHPEVGCVNVPRSCDDGLACTRDWCQDGECTHEAVVCQNDDRCSIGDCDDSTGLCVFKQLDNGDECDDGITCTVQDTCISGICQGHPTDDCPETCDGLLSPRMYRMATFFVSSTGLANPDRAGWPLALEAEGPDGLDLDGRSDTCAPWVGDGCNSGIDNAMGPIGAVLNPYAQDALDTGEAIILFDARGFDPAMQFDLAVYQGVETDEEGHVAVSDYGLNAGCEPRFRLPVAIQDGRMVNALPAPHTVQLSLPLGSNWIPLTLRLARIDARVDMDDVFYEGSTVTVLTGITGIVAGAVPKQEILDSVGLIPAQRLPDSITHEDLRAIVSFLVAEDMDTDGDGLPDAVSCAVHFAAVAQDVVPDVFQDPRVETPAGGPGLGD